METFTSMFEEWVLSVLEFIPELTILKIPDVVYNYLHDFITLVNCFVVFKDFVPILNASVMFGFIELTTTIVMFIKSFYSNSIKWGLRDVS